MLFRSTGLGRTELVGEIDSMRRQGDYLILHVNVVEPVRWKIRAAFNYRDLGAVLRVGLKMSVIAFVLFPLRLFRSATHPGDF